MRHSEDSDSDGEDLRDILYDNITAVRSTGSFATMGVVRDCCIPGITIDESVIRLPLSEEDARGLIAQSRQSPFGKGLETLVDVSVRNTWEIDASQVTFANPEWQTCLQRVVEDVTTELGISCGAENISAEFYKMLIYEEGAMFKPHRDVEKAPGMFGTLVICLPSSFAGGAVSLHHHQEVKSCDTSPSSAFGFSYIAWYADVLHEVQPVTAGIRWVLTYNLIQRAGSRLSAAGLDARTQSLCDILSHWDDPVGPQHMTFLFEHQYSQASLVSSHLKGNDFPRASHVIKACRKNGDFFVFLVNLRLVSTLDSEPWYDEESDDIWDHVSDTLQVTKLRGLDGLDILGSHLPVTRDLGFLVGNIKEQPFVQQGGEPLGNSNADIERLYGASCIAIVPKRSVLHFISGQCRHNDSTKFIVIRDLFRRIAAQTSPPRDEPGSSRDLLAKLTSQLLHSSTGASSMGLVAVAASIVPDEVMFRQALDQTTDGFDEATWRALGEEIDIQHPPVPEQLVIDALTKSRRLLGLHATIQAFISGHESSPLGRRGAPATVYWQGWLDTVLFEAIERLDSVHDEDARAVVDLLWQRKAPFRQFIAYQCIRKFIQRFMDGDWVVLVALDICARWEKVQECHKFLRSLLDQIMGKVWGQLDLGRGLNYFYRTYNWDYSSMYCACITKLHDTADSDHKGRLLKLVQAQVSTLSNERVKHPLILVMDMMLAQANTSSSDVKQDG